MNKNDYSGPLYKKEKYNILIETGDIVKFFEKVDNLLVIQKANSSRRN